jgi:hypothetical protein
MNDDARNFHIRTGIFGVSIEQIESSVPGLYAPVHVIGEQDFSAHRGHFTKVEPQDAVQLYGAPFYQMALARDPRAAAYFKEYMNLWYTDIASAVLALATAAPKATPGYVRYVADSFAEQNAHSPTVLTAATLYSPNQSKGMAEASYRHFVQAGYPDEAAAILTLAAAIFKSETTAEVVYQDLRGRYLPVAAAVLTLASANANQAQAEMWFRNYFSGSESDAAFDALLRSALKTSQASSTAPYYVDFEELSRQVRASRASGARLSVRRVPRAAVVRGEQDENGLASFFVGVARAQSFEAARFAVGSSIYNVRKTNGFAIARAHGLPVRRFALKLQNSSETKDASAESSLSLEDLRQLDRDAYGKVSALLDGVESNTEEPLIVKIDPALVPNRLYLEYLAAAVRDEREKPYGRNVTFVFESDDAPAGFLKKMPEDLKNTRVVSLADALKSGIAGQVNIPAMKWNEGDVPPLRALIKLSIHAGRVDLQNIPQGFRGAYEVLAGQALPDNATLRSILEGPADVSLRVRFALKPLVKVSLNQAVQFFRNMAKMLAQSA